MSESTSVSMGLKAITDKDELVKQHMKIAEEAIAGWERAEAEFADMKEKFEAVMEQKLATEDRVSHLDGALKECMKQLRLVREEQEQKIHEAVMKKTSEWERSGSCPDTEAKLHQVRDELCVALEENRTLSKSLQKSEETIAEQKACSSRSIADLEAKLRDSRNEVSKVIAEKMALSKSLQECEETMSELRHGKARLEGENSRLKIRLAAVEKENLRFKSELRTISKDLELKIDQDRMNKKSMQESRKKIANLEEECQRLRALLTAKKRTQNNTDSIKVQGSEMLSSAEKLSRGRQSPSRRSTSSLSFKTDSDVNGDVELLSEVESDHGNIKGQNRFLTDKVMVMALEAEAKPMLVRKGSNKYSIAEEQLENSSYSCCSGKHEGSSDLIQASFASISEDSTSLLTNAPITEPGTTFRKNNSTASSSASLHTSLISLDIMDDFAEMEKLASLSDSPQDLESEGEMSVPRDSSSDANILDFYEKKTDRGKRGNLEASESLEEYLKEKPEETESQFPSFPGKQESGKTTMNHLEELLAMKQGNGIMNLGKSTEIARLATTEEKRSVAAELKDHVNGDEQGVLVYRAIDGGDSANVWSMASSVSLIEQEDESSDKGFCNNAGAELASAVRKVLEIVESFGQSDYSFPYSQWASGPNNEHDNDGGEGDSPKRQWGCSGLHACVESLINLCNTLIQGKVDIIDFIAEIASALDWLVGLIFTPLEKSASTNCSQVKGHVVRSKGVIDHSSDSDLTSAGYSPSQTMHNASYLEDYNATGSQAQDIVVCDHSSISNLSFQFSASSVNVKEDISELPSENGSIKPSLEAELKKNARLDGEILRLRLVNDQLERNHESTMEKLTELHSQVGEANRKIHKLTDELMESQKWSAELKAELHEALDRKQFLENSFEELEREKNGLESESRKAKENVEVLQLKAVNLQKDLDAEIKWRKEAEMRYFELQKLHTEERRLSNEGSWSYLEGARLRKEQEIAAAAEKLSECQQTILDLGKQLKALGAPKNLLAQPLHSSSPVLLHQKASGGEGSGALYEMIDNDDSKGASSTSMNGREQRQDIMVMKPLKVPHSCAGYEEEDDIRSRRQANGRYGRQAQSLDMCNNSDNYNYNGSLNRFPSPITHDMSQESAQSSSSDLSPMRSSPSRFLGLRSKSNVNSPSEQVSGNYAENNENGEKHGSSSGLSRFFGGRTRSGH